MFVIDIEKSGNKSKICYTDWDDEIRKVFAITRFTGTIWSDQQWWLYIQFSRNTTQCWKTICWS